MTDLPTRLLVINARVPEGEHCEGCQFLHQSKTYEYECSLFGWTTLRENGPAESRSRWESQTCIASPPPRA